MKKLVLIVVILAILTGALFTLTGCSLKIETDDNSVSASVDEETQSTFESIIDWIVERLDRIFVTEENSGSSNEGESQGESV